MLVVVVVVACESERRATDTDKVEAEPVVRRTVESVPWFPLPAPKRHHQTTSANSSRNSNMNTATPTTTYVVRRTVESVPWFPPPAPKRHHQTTGATYILA